MLTDSKPLPACLARIHYEFAADVNSKKAAQFAHSLNEFTFEDVDLNRVMHHLAVQRMGRLLETHTNLECLWHCIDYHLAALAGLDTYYLRNEVHELAYEESRLPTISVPAMQAAYSAARSVRDHPWAGAESAQHMTCALPNCRQVWQAELDTLLELLRNHKSL